MLPPWQSLAAVLGSPWTFWRRRREQDEQREVRLVPQQLNTGHSDLIWESMKVELLLPGALLASPATNSMLIASLATAYIAPPSALWSLQVASLLLLTWESCFDGYCIGSWVAPSIPSLAFYIMYSTHCPVDWRFVIVHQSYMARYIPTIKLWLLVLYMVFIWHQS